MILASGPSLAYMDVGYARGKARVIAVNDTYKWAPWADILYAADERWWRANELAVDFRGERWTQDKGCRNWIREAGRRGINIIHSENKDGMSTAPGTIHLGANSAFQALNLAVLAGVKKVILTGLDCATYGGDTHFFGHHTGNLIDNSPYGMFRSYFNRASKQLKSMGIDVVNCSRRTSVVCFRKSTMRDEL